MTAKETPTKTQTQPERIITAIALCDVLSKLLLNIQYPLPPDLVLPYCGLNIPRLTLAATQDALRALLFKVENDNAE